jgi:hypothetical protein
MTGQTTEVIMTRLAACTLAVLTCAGAVLALGIGAAAAVDECNQRYKSCNLGCDQSIDAMENVTVCKGRCDFRLIACDRLPLPASTPGAGHTRQGVPPKANDHLHPVATGTRAR